MLRLRFHEDPGHGWVETTRSLIESLGIEPSGYSYERNGFVFLEEDCDAGLLFDALTERGIEFELEPVYHDRHCFVRTLPPYHP